MKSYTVHDQLRLVGKAWEIRHYLKRTINHTDGGQRSLSEWLTGLTHDSLTRLDNRDTSIDASRDERQRLRRGRKRDPRPIPFPSSE